MRSMCSQQHWSKGQSRGDAARRQAAALARSGGRHYEPLVRAAPAAAVCSGDAAEREPESTQGETHHFCGDATSFFVHGM